MTTLSLEEYVPRAGWERSFAAPFAVVNGAAFHLLSLHAAQQYGMKVPREETVGAVSYALDIEGFPAQLFVIQRGDRETSLSLHPLVRRGLPLTEAGLRHAEALIVDLWLEIERSIRFTCPDLTIRPLEIAPPLPRWEDGPEKVFAWQVRYAPGMTDKELAKRLGVGQSTISNHRSANGQSRPRRGRPKKNQ